MLETIQRAAIASFCFNENVPVIDGNVIRFYSRLRGVLEPVDMTDGKKIIREFAENQINGENANEFNQAVMEFGALHCTVSNPKCVSCPFNNECVSHATGNTHLIPIKAKKTKVKNRYLNYFVITHDEHTFIKQRGTSDIWAKLYDFPLIEGENIKTQAFSDLIYDGVEKLQNEVTRHQFKHQLSHQLLHISFIRIDLNSEIRFKDSSVLKIPLKSLKNYPVPRVIESYIPYL